MSNLTTKDRLIIAAEAIKQSNNHMIKEDYTPEDIARIASETNMKVEDYSKIIGTIIYVKRRSIYKDSKVKAFKVSFPARCVTTDDGKRLSTFGGFESEKEVGSMLPDQTILTKAKRLEEGKLYNSIYELISSNVYVMFALDRIKVLNEALDKSLDPDVSDRDKPQFMKLFLDATVKPEGLKATEINVNLQNNTVNLAQVEDKLNTISTQLEGSSAKDIIELVSQSRTSNDNR